MIFCNQFEKKFVKYTFYICSEKLSKNCQKFSKKKEGELHLLFLLWKINIAYILWCDSYSLVIKYLVLFIESIF